MIVLPAIDIKGGHCVRLEQGKEDEVTKYYDDPVEVAKMLEEQGAKYLHIIDLDGAFKSDNINFEIIKKIRKAVGLPIQVGGGISDIEKAEKYLDAGIDRIIIGTMAVKDPCSLKKLVEEYSHRIAVSVDAKGEKVAIKGWVEESDKTVFDFCRELKEIGVKTIIHTDISKDGMLTGPNIEVLSKLQEEIGDNIIAAGGMSSVKDLYALQEVGIYGAITGKALYEGKITMEEISKF